MFPQLLSAESINQMDELLRALLVQGTVILSSRHQELVDLRKKERALTGLFRSLDSMQGPASTDDGRIVGNPRLLES